MWVRQLFSWIVLLMMSIFGVLWFQEYRANHTYYIDMLKNNTNIMLVLRSLACASLPAYMIVTWSRFKYWAISILVWLVLFSLGFVWIRETFVGSGIVMMIINTTFVFALWAYFIVWLLALGSSVSRMTLRLPLSSFFDIVCIFGLGLTVYMLVNFFLIMMSIYYSPILRMLALGLGYLIYHQKSYLTQMQSVTTTTIQNFKKNIRTHKVLYITMIVLMVISFAYYYHGFVLAYIPYPTAWDANHAYMYIPKVFSLTHWYLRNNMSDSGVPMLWYSYIAFWFGLFGPLTKFWISPDTIAVQMNFLSGIFVLIGMLSLFHEVISLIQNYRNHSQTSSSATWIHHALFFLGWMYILLWLTSGMGAFLVFVDNKTDLWIMTLVVLGLIPGIRLINYLIYQSNNDVDTRVYSQTTLALLSWIFFAIAVLSKPTALFDVMSYGLLFVWLLCGIIMMCGVMFVLPAILSLLKANNVDQYIPKFLAQALLAGWLFLSIGDGIRHFLTQQMRHLKYLMIRVCSFLCVLVLIKAPIIIATSIRRDVPLSPSILVKRILLWSYNHNNASSIHASNPASRILLVSNDLPALIQKTNAHTWQESGLESCKVQSYTTGELYQDLKAVIGDAYKEDVGRYVWYGQKEFKNPRRKFLLPSDACISLHQDVRILCRHTDVINKYDLGAYQTLLNKLPQWSEWYNVLQQIIASWSTISVEQSEIYKVDSVKKINTYRSERSIKTTADAVLIPYFYLIPFNITFNRSLQNLSSYYTDIGVVRLPLFFLVILALIYACIRRDRLLGVIAAVTLFAWWLWMMIGWAILRYGIGLIIWSILTMIVFLDRLVDHRQNMSQRSVYHAILLCMIVRALVQFTLNFTRISSQGWWWPFVQYKFSNGTTQEIDQTLAGRIVNKFPYTAKDIVNIQFPHYNKVIRIADQRSHDQVIMIAGTYLQYFLGNQYNIAWDWFLTELWRLTSDGSQCKSYLRLKDKNRKYMAIDPNIGTVVMGGGNSTLFDRFFAKMDPVKGTIVQDGTMTMLSKMVSQWYLKMLYSNNLWAKYAYTLSDTYIASKVWSQDPNMLALARARIATARFWQNGQQLLGLVQTIFAERISNGDGIGDIADILGKDIDADKLKTITTKLVAQGKLDALTLAQYTKDLNQDERLILGQYMQLFQLLRSNKAQFDQAAMNLIGQSVWGSSQVIFFEIL